MSEISKYDLICIWGNSFTFLLVIAILAFVVGNGTSFSTANRFNKALQNIYEYAGHRLFNYAEPMLKMSVGILRWFSKIVSFVAGLSVLIALFYLNSLVHAAYSEVGLGALFHDVAPQVAALKHVLQFSLLGALVLSIVLGIVVAVKWSEQVGRNGVRSSIGWTESLLFLGLVIAAAVPSFYGVYFLFTTYPKIIGTLANSGPSVQFIISQLYLFPLNNLSLALPSAVIVWLASRTVPVLGTVDLSGTAARDAAKAREALSDLDDIDAGLPEELKTALKRAASAPLSKEGLLPRNRSWLTQTYVSGVAISFMYTTFAVIVGSVLSPNSPYQFNAQLLVVNSVFDGFTLSTVMTLSVWALADGKFETRWLPCAFLSVVFSELFAVLSIVAGTAGTAHAIGISQALALSVAWVHFDPVKLGPYFWVMNSTMLPVAFSWICCVVVGYLSILISHLVIEPITKLFNKDPKAAWSRCALHGCVLAGPNLWGAYLLGYQIPFIGRPF